MRRALSPLLACLLFTATLRAASDDEAQARKTVLDLAGAFSNDGFKVRDGNWTGSIHPGETLLLQVHLYAGNQYWFMVGGSAAAKQLAVSLFDETGALLQSSPFKADASAAAGFAAPASGPYYVRIQELAGEPSSFCFIYSYK